jgi:DNA-binding transcriptional MocR family regulator
VTQIEAARPARSGRRRGHPDVVSFAVGENALAGIVLGYGGIATTDIQEGLRRLGKCFGQLEPGGTTIPL